MKRLALVLASVGEVRPGFGGTFVTVRRHGKDVIMGFAQHGVVIELGVPFIPVCD
jgi:predicted SpoU family rRNA methylase